MSHGKRYVAKTTTFFKRSPLSQSYNLSLYSAIELLGKVNHLLIFLVQLFTTAVCDVTESSDT